MTDATPHPIDLHQAPAMEAVRLALIDAHDALTEALGLTESGAHDLAGAHVRKQAMEARVEARSAIDRLAALAAPIAPAAGSEPVAIAEEVKRLLRVHANLTMVGTQILSNAIDRLAAATPTPAAPTKVAESLTDERIDEIYAEHSGSYSGECVCEWVDSTAFARAIEAAHGIAPKGSPAGSEGKV